jgi:hypothetical protein
MKLSLDIFRCRYRCWMLLRSAAEGDDAVSLSRERRELPVLSIARTSGSEVPKCKVFLAPLSKSVYRVPVAQATELENKCSDAVSSTGCMFGAVLVPVIVYCSLHRVFPFPVLGNGITRRLYQLYYTSVRFTVLASFATLG